MCIENRKAIPWTTCLPVADPSRRLRFGTGYHEGDSRRIATVDVRRDSHPSSIHAWFRPGEARKRLPCGKLKRYRQVPEAGLPYLGYLDLAGFASPADSPLQFVSVQSAGKHGSEARTGNVDRGLNPAVLAAPNEIHRL